MTEEEIAAFLDVTVARREHVPSAVWRLLAVTGARLGEVLWLTPAAVRPDSITFAGQVTRNPKGRVVIKSTLKTSRALRSVQIDAATSDLLRAHRKAQAEARLLVGSEWRENGLLFTDAFGKPLNPVVVARAFKRLSKAAEGPAIRLHDVRHTNATLLLEAGIPPHVVAAPLGLSIDMLMKTHAHVLPQGESPRGRRRGHVRSGECCASAARGDGLTAFPQVDSVRSLAGVVQW